MDLNDPPKLAKPEEPMDFMEKVPNDSILMNFEEMLASNFNGNYNIDTELEENNEIFEKLIFGSDENEKSNNLYNILDVKTSKKVLDAVEKTEGKRKI